MRGRIVILALLVAVLAGCGPKLQAVRDYSSATLVATDQAKTFISYLPESCKRISQSTTTIDPAIAEGSKDDFKKWLVDSSCENNVKCANGLNASILLLEGYVTALQRLSADLSVPTNLALGDIKTQITQATDSAGNKLFTDAEKTNGAFSIIELLINSATRAYQKKELQRYITSYHASALILYDAIITRIEKIYPQQIDVEEQQISIDYGDRFAKVKSELNKADKSIDHNENNTAVLFLTLNEKNSKLEKLQLTKSLIVTTVELLKESKSTLIEIYKSRDKLDSDELSFFVEAYYNDVLKGVKQFN